MPWRCELMDVCMIAKNYWFTNFLVAEFRFALEVGVTQSRLLI